MIGDVLKAEIDRYAQELRSSGKLFALARRGRLTPVMVGRYFAGLAFLIDRTQTHLRLARDEALASGATELGRYFDQKVREEAGHEEWAHSDLDRLGEHFETQIPREATSGVLSLVKAIEEGIRTDPYLYLAYTFFAEYLTVSLGPEWVAALEEQCGVPRSAMTVATHHIALDESHAADGAREIEALVDDPRRFAPLRAMLATSMRHFSEFCDEVCSAAA